MGQGIMSRPKRSTTIAGLVLYLLCVGSLFFIDDDHLRTVRAVLTLVNFLVITGFCISYHVETRGHWRDTIHGVHIMTFSLAFALMFAFICLALFGLVPMWLLGKLGAFIYLTVLFLWLWRWAILRAGQRVPPKASG